MQENPVSIGISSSRWHGTLVRWDVKWSFLEWQQKRSHSQVNSNNDGKWIANVKAYQVSWTHCIHFLCLETLSKERELISGRVAYSTGKEIPGPVCLTNASQILNAHIYIKYILRILDQISLTPQPLILRRIGILESRYKELQALPGFECLSFGHSLCQSPRKGTPL